MRGAYPSQDGERVGDFPKVESVAGHRRASLAAVFALDDAAKVVDAYLVRAHHGESAHYGAHHVAQKAVGGDSEHPL